MAGRSLFSAGRGPSLAWLCSPAPLRGNGDDVSVGEVKILGAPWESVLCTQPRRLWAPARFVPRWLQT